MTSKISILGMVTLLSFASIAPLYASWEAVSAPGPIVGAGLPGLSWQAELHWLGGGYDARAEPSRSFIQSIWRGRREAVFLFRERSRLLVSTLSRFQESQRE